MSGDQPSLLPGWRRARRPRRPLLNAAHRTHLVDQVASIGQVQLGQYGIHQPVEVGGGGLHPTPIRLRVAERRVGHAEPGQISRETRTAVTLPQRIGGVVVADVQHPMHQVAVRRGQRDSAGFVAQQQTPDHLQLFGGLGPHLVVRIAVLPDRAGLAVIDDDAGDAGAGLGIGVGRGRARDQARIQGAGLGRGGGQVHRECRGERRGDCDCLSDYGHAHHNSRQPSVDITS